MLFHTLGHRWLSTKISKIFFPTIDFARVAGLFRGFGYSPAVATIFALLCTEAPRRRIQRGDEIRYAAVGNRSLPQGACTSPAISNLISRRLDKRLSKMAHSVGWRFTRYADDLTFSTSTAPAKIGYILSRVQHIVEDEGFVIRKSKTRVLKRCARQSVTGVIVNDRPSIDRKVIRRLRAILHRAKLEGLDAQNREHRPNFRRWVQGMIAYIEMINPAQGGRLRRDYEALKR